MKTPKYCIVVGTINRSPQENYLPQMLRNMARSGLWESSIPFQLDIIDSGSIGLDEYKRVAMAEIPAVHPQKVMFHPLTEDLSSRLSPQYALKDKRDGHLRRSRNGNALECFRIGIESRTPWILFLEDDIDVCRDFLGSVDRWLSQHARRDRHMYSFATPYKMVCDAWKAGQTSWNFPVKGFYGNQALAFTRADASSAFDYIYTRLKEWDTGQGFDLLLKDWATMVWRAEHFLSSVPSFAQHIGKESSIHLGRFHEVSGFSGID